MRGNIEVETQGVADLLDSTVGGSLKLAGGLGAIVEGGSIAGNVGSSGSEFVLLFGPAIGGNVKVTAARTAAFGGGLVVNGTLEALESEFFDLHDSTVNGNFYVRGTLVGSIFCGNTLNGDAEFTDNEGVLIIGLPVPSCAGNELNGNVAVLRNQADTEISDNDIGGNLACFENVPPPIGGGNRVHGHKEGQCAAL